MFCPKCGKQLPEAGDCPVCGQSRPSLGPLRAVGCGLSGVALGILAGVVVGVLICMGILSTFMRDLGKLIGIH